MPPKNSSHHWIIPVVCFIVVAVLVVFGLKSAKEAPPLPNEEIPATTIEWPSRQIRKETISESPKGYEINAAYPVTASEGITSVFRNFVNDTIASFKTDTTEAGPLPEGYRAMTLDISYEERVAERADNYVFSVYTDTGGAHGFQAAKTFSFNKEGAQIMLVDLFTNGIRGLGVIADVVKKELMKREFADNAWISEGAAPTEENYRNFVIEDGGVTFIFDPYQVAPYAAGTQTVLVPTSAFKSIANPEIFGTR